MAVGIIVVLTLAGILVWQFTQTKNALATTVVTTRKSVNDATTAVNGAFHGARGVLWTDDSGPGTLNKRRRGKDNGITMSITVEPSPTGGSKVSMWASQYNEYFIFFANFAGSVNSRKKAIAQVLA